MIAFNFTTGSLDPRITFARVTNATNPATYIDANGAIIVASNNQARFDYSGGVCQGLLIEESRTNSLINSILNGAVTGTPGTPPTSHSNLSTTGAISAITAGQYSSGFKITLSTSNTRRTFFQTMTVAANSAYTFSFTVDINTTFQVYTVMDLINAPAGSTLSWTLDGVSVNNSIFMSVGKHVVTGTITTSGTSGTVQARWGLGLQGNVTGTAVIENMQFELGSFRTSYIPTTTAALTRNADVATITGTNFSDWWQSNQGGAIVRARPSTVSGTHPWVQFDDGTANEIIALRGNTTNPELYIVDGGSPQAQIDAGTIAANTDYSLTGWWETNDCKARLDGGAVITDTSATIPTVTQARLGSDGTNYLNGYLASIIYYETFFGQIYTRRKNKAIFTLM